MEAKSVSGCSSFKIAARSARMQHFRVDAIGSAACQHRWGEVHSTCTSQNKMFKESVLSVPTLIVKYVFRK